MEELLKKDIKTNPLFFRVSPFFQLTVRRPAGHDPLVVEDVAFKKS